MPERFPSPALEPYSAIVPERDDGAWQWVLLILAAAVVYASSFSGIMTFGDEDTIVTNETIRHIFPLSKHLATERPLVSLSFAINYAMDVPKLIGYHTFNLLVHLLASITLFGIVRRTLLRPQFEDKYKETADWLALAVSLLWCVHPLLTQSVTYISERSESMMGLFYLLTLYLVIRSAASNRPLAWFLLAFVACAMGMASKSVMVTAPIVILLYDRAFLAESFARAFRWRWSLYLLLAATWYIPFHTGIVHRILADDAGIIGLGIGDPSSWEYLRTQPGVILHYVRLAFWPDPLCLDYGWSVTHDTLHIAVPAAALLIVLALTLWMSFSRPAIGFFGIWFFFILAPTSSIIPIREIAAEHRMYLPLIAIVAATVLLAQGLFERIVLSHSLQKTAMTLFVIAATVVLGYCTYDRNTVYQDGVSLWQDTLKTNRSGVRPHAYLARYYKTKDITKAVGHWAAVLAIDPDNIDALLNLSIYYGDRGQTQRAIDYCQHVLNIAPDLPDAYYNLGVLYQDAERHEEAVKAFRNAQERNPTNLDTYARAAQSLEALGRTQEAIDEWTRGIQTVGPDYEPTQLASVHLRLGNAYIRENQFEAAIKEFRRAIMHNPKHSAAHHSLGWALAKEGRFAEAELALKNALAYNPESEDIKRTLKIVQDHMAGAGRHSPTSQLNNMTPDSQPAAETTTD